MSKFFGEVDKGLYTNFSSTISNKKIAEYIITDWRNSQKIEDMITANAYYVAKNINIQSKTRSYIDNNNCVVDNPTLSNTKIASGFLRRIIQQKVNYAFGKPFVLSIENIDLFKRNGEKQQVEEYITYWNDFLNNDFRLKLLSLAKKAIKNGIGWIYIYINESGNLGLTVIDSETMYPQWSDKAHTELDCVVRDYKILAYNEGTRQIINLVEYWDKEALESYVENGGYLTPYYTDKQLMNDVIPEDLDPKEPLRVYPITYELNQEIIKKGWGKVPFLALKGEEDETPLLNIIKAQIDAYDKLNSKSVDSLIDDVDPVVVLKQVSAELKDIVVAREAMKNSRMISVDENGGAEYLQVSADITAVQNKLEHLRKDIREFSNSVDVQDVKLGNNPSGVALKSMYQDLDVFVNGLEIEFQLFMDKLKYFFDMWLELTGRGTVEQWNKYKLTIKLDRDMMINAAELVDQCVKLSTIVSRKTVDEYNPAVQSHEIEEARRKAELNDYLAQTELDILEDDVNEKQVEKEINDDKQTTNNK